MPQAELRHVLGAPHSDYGDHWAYSRALSWPIVHVYFDESQRFTKSVYDP